MTIPKSPPPEGAPPGPGSDPASIYDNISANRASVLLRLGLPSPRNAADDLVDRLESPGGSEWATEVMRRDPFTSVSIDLQSLTAVAPLNMLIALKDLGKDMVKSPSDRDGYLAGLAGYYLAIAAAIVQHRQVITRTPRQELSQILIEIASVAPAPWASVFMRAAEQV